MNLCQRSWLGLSCPFNKPPLKHCEVDRMQDARNIPKHVLYFEEVAEERWLCCSECRQSFFLSILQRAASLFWRSTDSIWFNLIMRSTFVSLLRKGMPNLRTSDDWGLSREPIAEQKSESVQRGVHWSVYDHITSYVLSSFCVRAMHAIS